MQDQGQQGLFRRVCLWLLGVIKGAFLLIGCVFVAYLITGLINFLLPDILPSGRGLFVPVFVIMAALIAMAGLWWSLARGHGWVEMLVSLVLTETLLIGLIFFFSGSARLDSFLLDWFLGVNLYFGLPWLVAIGLRLFKTQRHN